MVYLAGGLQFCDDVSAPIVSIVVVVDPSPSVEQVVRIWGQYAQDSCKRGRREQAGQATFYRQRRQITEVLRYGIQMHLCIDGSMENKLRGLLTPRGGISCVSARACVSLLVGVLSPERGCTYVQ